MKASKLLLCLSIFLLIASCESKGSRDKKICALYEEDKIDAVKALDSLGLKPNENGGRFKPVELFCGKFKVTN